MAVRTPPLSSPAFLDTNQLDDVLSPVNLGTPSSLKGVFMDKPVLEGIRADDPAIDYIGRWDDTKTARWAGSSLRFTFTGPLLFLIPGPRTAFTVFPTVGWQVDGITYTATARPSTAIRLWPPEGTAHTVPSTPDLAGDNGHQELGDLPILRQSQNGVATATSMSRAGTSSRPVTPTMTRNHSWTTQTASRLIEITLIDWGSVLQVSSLQTLSGYGISPAFPEGIANLPTMLFIGDSITSGFVAPPSSVPDYTEEEKEYCGFLDAYPSHLRSILSPGVRVSAVAFPGIRLADDEDASSGIEGMESKWFKTGPFPGTTGEEDWDFDDRDSEAGPTHILVNLGTNDTLEPSRFLQTYEGFLSLLKETHGRRTGDILVLAPFGARYIGEGANQGKYFGKYVDDLKEMVSRLSQKWHEEDDDPLSSGDFPTTPMLELTKMHLDSTSSSPPEASQQQQVGHRRSLSAKILAAASASNPSTPTQSTFSSTDSSIPSAASSALPNSASIQSISSVASIRPSLVVRPSSIAAISPTARGTKARLHFVDTKDWLDDGEDTFDGLHPTRKGATKIAKRLREWLGDNGFLLED